VLRSERGYRLPLRPGLEGALRRARVSSDRCWAGWAWDPEGDEPVPELIVLVDGVSEPAVVRRPPRPARAVAEGDPRLQASGVRLCLGEPPPGGVRIFAISRHGGYASELPLVAREEEG
jgi:hypothetical protein